MRLARGTIAPPPAGRRPDGTAARHPTTPTGRPTILEPALRVAFAASTFAAVGVLIFLRTAWDGAAREYELLCRTIERAAAVAALVAAVQLPVRAATLAGGWAGAADELAAVAGGAYGRGLALRVAGALMLAVGARALRRRPLASPAAAALGASLLVGSFWVAGYAAAAEPRVVARVSLVAHVLAVAAWGGGLLALALVLRHRVARGRPLRAAHISLRFSVVATAAVVVAAAAGVALAAVRLDAVSALWTTAYGILLLVKVALVTGIAAVGAYNHLVVVPVLRATPDHAVARHLRVLAGVEVGLFLLVVISNSVLVGLAR